MLSGVSTVSSLSCIYGSVYYHLNFMSIKFIKKSKKGISVFYFICILHLFVLGNYLYIESKKYRYQVIKQKEQSKPKRQDNYMK